MSKMSRSEAGLLGAIHTQQLRLSRYQESPLYCSYCGEKLPYEKRHNKYCNHACAASMNNKGIARNCISGEYAAKECLCCGKITNNKKYCSYKCNSKYRWQQIVKKIDESGFLPQANNGVYDYNPIVGKKYLAEKRGRKCEICGGETWQDQPMPLVLDHKNGNPNDNRIDNLRLVCGNCNMQLPTFAGGNRGKGRESQGKKRNH